MSYTTRERYQIFEVQEVAKGLEGAWAAASVLHGVDFGCYTYETRELALEEVKRRGSEDRVYTILPVVLT